MGDELLPEWLRDSVESMQMHAELAPDRIRRWSEAVEAQWHAAGCPDVISIPITRTPPPAASSRETQETSDERNFKSP